MKTKINQRRARALTFMLSLGMLAGVLIWAKLRLVTDIPRSALAEPREVERPRAEPGDSEVHIEIEPVDSIESFDEIDERAIEEED